MMCPVRTSLGRAQQARTSELNANSVCMFIYIHVLVECYPLLASGVRTKIRSTYNVTVCTSPITYKYIYIYIQKNRPVDMTRRARSTRQLHHQLTVPVSMRPCATSKRTLLHIALSYIKSSLTSLVSYQP